MNPSTSLGTRSKVGMAKPSPPVRQAGNIGHLLVIRGVYRRSLPSAYAHVKYRCRCRGILRADLNAWCELAKSLKSQGGFTDTQTESRLVQRLTPLFSITVFQ